MILGGGYPTLAARTINPVLAAQPLAVPAIGAAFAITLTQNTTLSITGAVAGSECNVDVLLTQDATGGRTVTWWAGITWLPGSAPSLPQGPGASLLCTFVSLDGGTTWYGSYGGAAAIEPWRVVGAAGQPAFQNAWANFGAGYAQMQFAKTASGLVLLQGAITNITANNNTVVFTLPAGYRPAADFQVGGVLWTGTAFAFAQWIIRAIGNVQGGGSASPPNQLIINTTFRAEQ